MGKEFYTIKMEIFMMGIFSLIKNMAKENIRPKAECYMMVIGKMI
jgi:hypothetical protein